MPARGARETIEEMLSQLRLGPARRDPLGGGEASPFAGPRMGADPVATALRPGCNAALTGCNAALASCNWRADSTGSERIGSNWRSFRPKGWNAVNLDACCGAVAPDREGQETLA